jgi:hypothetical protein
MADFEVLFRNLPEGPEENPKKHQARYLASGSRFKRGTFSVQKRIAAALFADKIQC